MKTVEQIIADYKAAFEHANGHTVVVIHLHGWFKVGYSHYRRADILAMTITLLSRPAWEKDQ